jgi:hypothetical protein
VYSLCVFHVRNLLFFTRERSGGHCHSPLEKKRERKKKRLESPGREVRGIPHFVNSGPLPNMVNGEKTQTYPSFRETGLLSLVDLGQAVY